jgi:hypothetical protein
MQMTMGGGRLSLLTAVSEPSRMKGCSLASPPMTRGSRRRASSVPARGRPSSRSLLASSPSMAEENRSRPPLTGAATAPTSPSPTPLTKPAHASDQHAQHAHKRSHQLVGSNVCRSNSL